MSRLIEPPFQKGKRYFFPEEVREHLIHPEDKITDTRYLGKHYYAHDGECQPIKLTYGVDIYRMEKTRHCPICGARMRGATRKQLLEYTVLHQGCGKKIKFVTCPECGLSMPALEHPLFTKYYRDKVRLEKYYDELLRVDCLYRPIVYNQIKQTSLTQARWIELLRHFKTCPICGDDENSYKMMILSNQEGGSLTSHNVLPVCERCFNMRAMFNMFNIFILFDTQNPQALNGQTQWQIRSRYLPSDSRNRLIGAIRWLGYEI